MKAESVMARLTALVGPPEADPPEADPPEADPPEADGTAAVGPSVIGAGGRGWVPSRPIPAVPMPSELRVAEQQRAPEEERGSGREPERLLDLQSRALSSAMAAYSAAHGEPNADGLAHHAGRRWGLRVRVGLAAAAALLALGGLVVVRSMQQAPAVLLPDAAPAGVPGATPGGVPGSPAVSLPEVVVHVVGQVVAPGLVRLPEGSRVADAVESAGGAGPEADLSALNLARVLVDGEQVVVPGPGEAPAAGTGGGSGVGGASLVDLNTADAATLDGLPGVGPVIAQRIVDWRTAHGPFTVVDELAEVTGIGPAVLAGVRDLVRVG